MSLENLNYMENCMVITLRPTYHDEICISNVWDKFYQQGLGRVLDLFLSGINPWK